MAQSLGSVLRSTDVSSGCINLMESAFTKDEKLYLSTAPIRGFNSRFRAYHNAVQGLPAAPNWITVQFNTELFDDLNEYNNANGLFTASQDGRYLIICQLSMTVAAGSLVVAEMERTFGAFLTEAIIRNDDVVQHSKTLNLVAIRNLTAGQTIRIRAQFQGGLAVFVNGGETGANFSAHRLS
jgi:hypothetical protein